MNKDEISKLIDTKITNSLKFSSMKTGDTPTDALQLVNKKYVDTRSYVGFVNINGNAGTPFPSGWTSSRTSTGNFTITHNLGTTNYAVLLTFSDFDAIGGTDMITVLARNSNNFTVTAANTTPAYVNPSFSFLLVMG